MDTRSRGREMHSDSVRVIPVFREHIDVKLFCQAIIEIAKSLADEKNRSGKAEQDDQKQTK